ncbi:hypothetical protein ABZW18_14690 [Streptomyces sp. NPDC004647]|uniref:hypothetical protein n=1 Tax=Streptomyces sp. NPDC004647 TaxID=3154671 RepID=UPI0033A96B58
MSFGQEGPLGPGGSNQSTPDWGAMADHTAARMRRRRLMMIGGGALATAAVAAIVATAVVSSGSGGNDKPQGLPSPETLPGEPKEPEPTFSDVSVPPPPDPRDFISSKAKDTAPLNARTLFPSATMSTGAGSYKKSATDATNSCAAVVSSRLAPALTGNKCTQMIRATYEKAGVAVTVGVALFDTEAQASKAKTQASGNVQSLAGGGVPSFCRATACRLTANSVGRYAYFTVSGYSSGKAVPASDTKARQAGKDVADYTFARIVDRGEDQAAAAASAQAG